MSVIRLVSDKTTSFSTRLAPVMSAFLQHQRPHGFSKSVRHGTARWPDPCPFFTGTCTVLVSPDNRAVDHHIVVVTIGGQMPENPFDHAAFAPAAQSPVDVFPVTKTDRQITPGNAGTVTIQNRFQKQTVSAAVPPTWPSRPGRKSFICSHWLSLRPYRRIHSLPENREKTSQIKREYKPHGARC